MDIDIYIDLFTLSKHLNVQIIIDSINKYIYDEV